MTKIDNYGVNKATPHVADSPVDVSSEVATSSSSEFVPTPIPAPTTVLESVPKQRLIELSPPLNKSKSPSFLAVIESLDRSSSSHQTSLEKVRFNRLVSATSAEQIADNILSYLSNDCWLFDTGPSNIVGTNDQNSEVTNTLNRDNLSPTDQVLFDKVKEYILEHIPNNPPFGTFFFYNTVNNQIDLTQFTFCDGAKKTFFHQDSKEVLKLYGKKGSGIFEKEKAAYKLIEDSNLSHLFVKTTRWETDGFSCRAEKIDVHAGRNREVRINIHEALEAHGLVIADLPIDGTDNLGVIGEGNEKRFVVFDVKSVRQLP